MSSIGSSLASSSDFTSESNSNENFDDTTTERTDDKDGDKEEGEGNGEEDEKEEEETEEERVARELAWAQAELEREEMEKEAKLEITKTNLLKKIASLHKEVVEKKLLLWFLERAFKRMQMAMRKKDKELIEANVPSFITPKVIEWEELKRNMAGPSTFIRERADAESRDSGEDGRPSSVSRVTKSSGQSGAKSEDSTVEDFEIMKLSWSQKIELLQMELKQVQVEGESEMNELNLAMRKTKASKQEKMETSKEIKEVSMLFESQVEHRGYLSSKSNPRSTIDGRRQTVTMLARSISKKEMITYDATALRKFHNYFMTRQVKTAKLLRLSAGNLKRRYEKLVQMAHRKRENGAVATQTDMDALSAKFNLINDRDAELDKDRKDIQWSLTDAIFEFRKATKKLEDLEKKIARSKKEIQTRKQLMVDLGEDKVKVEAEVSALRKELSECRYLSNTYEQPSTVEYIAVTARNQKLRKDIAAANIKVNIAMLALKETRKRWRFAMIHAGRGGEVGSSFDESFVEESPADFFLLSKRSSQATNQVKKTIEDEDKEEDSKGHKQLNIPGVTTRADANAQLQHQQQRHRILKKAPGKTLGVKAGGEEEEEGEEEAKKRVGKTVSLARKTSNSSRMTTKTMESKGSGRKRSMFTRYQKSRDKRENDRKEAEEKAKKAAEEGGGEENDGGKSNERDDDDDDGGDGGGGNADVAVEDESDLPPREKEESFEVDDPIQTMVAGQQSGLALPPRRFSLGSNYLDWGTRVTREDVWVFPFDTDDGVSASPANKSASASVPRASGGRPFGGKASFRSGDENQLKPKSNVEKPSNSGATNDVKFGGGGGGGGAGGAPASGTRTGLDRVGVRRADGLRSPIIQGPSNSGFLQGSIDSGTDNLLRGKTGQNPFSSSQFGNKYSDTDDNNGGHSTLNEDTEITVTKLEHSNILDGGSMAVGIRSSSGGNPSPGGGPGGGGRGGGFFVGGKAIADDVEGTFILPKIVRTSDDLSGMPKTHNIASGIALNARQKLPLI